MFAMTMRRENQGLSSQSDDVEGLRRCLIQLNAWPEAGDAFLSLIPKARWEAPPLTERDQEWLPVVVRDALEGRDLGACHPNFFQKLLTNEQLRRTFLDRLGMLDEE